MKVLIDHIDSRHRERLLLVLAELQATYEVLNETEEEEDRMMLAYLKQSKDDEIASREETEKFINSLG